MVASAPLVFLALFAGSAPAPVTTTPTATPTRRPAPAAVFYIVLRDGSRLQTTRPPEMGGRYTLVYPPDRKPLSVPTEDVDSLATRRANTPPATPTAATSTLVGASHRTPAATKIVISIEGDGPRPITTGYSSAGGGSSTASGRGGPKTVHVKEYQKSDGTTVKSHDRAAPGTAKKN